MVNILSVISGLGNPCIYAAVIVNLEAIICISEIPSGLGNPASCDVPFVICNSFESGIIIGVSVIIGADVVNAAVIIGAVAVWAAVTIVYGISVFDESSEGLLQLRARGPPSNSPWASGLL